jgi:hypothetical protein
LRGTRTQAAKEEYVSSSEAERILAEKAVEVAEQAILTGDPGRTASPQDLARVIVTALVGQEWLSPGDMVKAAAAVAQWFAINEHREWGSNVQAHIAVSVLTNGGWLA